MSWGDQPTGEQKTLRTIGDRLNAPPSDSTENLIYLNKSVKFISGMVDVMQNGIDDANKDILLKIQDAIEDLLIIFGLSSSGDTLNFEWGELATLLKNFSSIFSLQRLTSGDWAQLPFNVQIGWIKDIWDNIFGKLSLQNLLGVGTDNMIAIGHFDTRSQVPSVPGWTFDNTVGHETLGCAKATANGTEQYLPLSYISVKPGDQLPVVGWFNTAGVTGTGQTQLIAQAYTSEGVKVGSDTIMDSEAVSGTMAWTQLSGTYTVPATAASVRFGPRFTDQVLTGVLRYDDFTATKPKNFLDISWIIGLIQSVFDMSWLSELSISQLGPAGSVNLLNGTFDDPASIDLTAAPGWSHNATVGRTNPGSAEASANGTRRVLRTKAFKASPGTKMDLSAYVKWAGVTASAGTAFTISVVNQLAGADVSTTQIASISSPGASGGWSLMSGLQHTVPAGVDYVRVQITVEAVVTAGTINFDDASLTRQGSLPQDWIVNLIPDLGGIRTKATETIDNIMNGLGFFGTGFSPGSLLGAVQNVPQANIQGLASSLSGLLPKADWFNFLGGFTAAGNNGTAPSTGITAIDDMISSFLGVRTKAITAQTTANSIRDSAVISTQVGDLLITRRSLTQTLGTPLSWTIPAATAGYALQKTVIQQIGAGNAGSYSTNSQRVLYVPGGLPGGLVSREFDAANFPAGTTFKYLLGAGGVGTTTRGVGASGGPTWLKNNAETVTYISPVPGVAELLKLTDSVAAGGAPGAGGDGGGCLSDSSYDGTSSKTSYTYFDGKPGMPSAAGPGGTQGYSSSGWFGSSYTPGGNGIDAPTNDPFFQRGGSGGGGAPGRDGGFVTQTAAGRGGYPGGGGGACGLFGAGIGSTRTASANGGDARIDVWTYERLL